MSKKWREDAILHPSWYKDFNFNHREGATARFVNIRQSAFTLAEVLITLGVIGVVAALTMPSVINTAQKMVLRNQFKRSYSLITNAINKTSYDLGYTPACYGWQKSKNSPTCAEYNDAGTCTKYTTPDGSSLPGDTWGNTSGCTEFYNQFIKEFNVIKTCSSNAYPDCIPDYKGIDEIRQADYDTDPSDPNYIPNYGEQATASGGCNYLRKNTINSQKAFVTNDGMIIFAYSGGYKFAVDVNGKKGPNKWGYDLYSLRMDAVEEGAPPIIKRGECNTVEEGGTSTTALLQNMSK